MSPVPVSRYQHEDSKRKIRRLEQCAQSSLQRAIASQGALAILYGRRLKYYIRETEVLTEVLFFELFLLALKCNSLSDLTFGHGLLGYLICPKYTM